MNNYSMNPSLTLPLIRGGKGWGLIGILLFVTASLHAQLAIKGEIVYTMSGAPIRDGIVLIKGDKIERVDVAAGVAIPAGYKVMNAKVVTPGLIDARSVVGLAGMYNYAHDQSQIEKSDPMQPELRAIDAYNPREHLVEWLRNLGITTLHTGHAPGALASGTTIVVKATGNTVNEALVDSTGMVAFTLGESVSNNFKSPGTRSKSVAMMRSDFLKAKEYLKNKQHKDADKRPAPDLKLEMLARVLNGEVKALVTAHQATEIMTALRLQKEFGFTMVLDGAAEAYLLLDEIKKSGVPVILHPTMMRHYGDGRNVSFETAAKLQQAGILFAIQGGYESYVPKTRVVLYEAAVAAANGLAFDDALASITINPARILGLDKRIGSLDAGKDADVVLYDGDPFEYTTHVCGVIVNGNVVSEKCK
ncbi:MAG: amidohydrolase family protein [Bacteroidota bacterium]